MDNRKMLINLIKEYCEDYCDTKNFTDKFNKIYDLETDYSSLEKEEHLLLKELSDKTGRFSSCEQDLSIPNMYFSEIEIKKLAQDVYCRLYAENKKNE